MISEGITKNKLHYSYLLIIKLLWACPSSLVLCFLFSSVYLLKSTSILIDATLVIKKSCTSMRLRRFITGLTTRWLFRTYASC
nr:MAG TPA: hypothetical protein [Caudoviricetes sp.]